MKGSIKRARDGKWYLRVEIGVDPATGKRRQRHETVNGSKAEAQKRLRAVIAEAESGVTGAKHVTIAQYAVEWLEAKRLVVQPLTIEGYELHVRRFILPTIGAVRLDDLTPAHVRAALTSWLAVKVADRTITARTAGSVLMTLRGMLNRAMKDRLIAFNVASDVEMPRVRHREMTALDPAGVLRLVRAARGDDQLAIVLLASTGLRRGEAFGLRWSDIDFEGARISVRRSLETIVTGGTPGGVRYKAPKTHSSARTISVDAALMARLRGHRTAQAQRLDSVADAAVFDDGAGGPADLKAFSKRFARIAEKAGVTARLHDLRHTYGTLQLSAGTDLKTVSLSMGHSTIGTTANLYLHAVDSLQRAAADRMGALLGESVAQIGNEKAESATYAVSVQKACKTQTATGGKPRRSSVSLVAGTGFEPVTFGL